MLRLALVEGSDYAKEYERVALRIQDGRFSAVVADDVETALSRAESVGAEIWSDGFDKLLADHGSAFDAVVFHSSIEQDCLLAAEAGKHILTDLPIALSKDAALQIIAECSAAGVSLMATQPYRFSPSVQTIKKSVASGQLGDPGLVRIHSWKASARHEDEQEDTERLLLSRIANEIDLTCWLFGGRPELVYAVERNRSRPVEYVQVHLGFTGGAMALIDYSETLPQGDGYFSLSLIGSTGAAYADDHRNMQLLYDGGHPSALNLGEGDTLFLSQLQEFINAVQEQREPLVAGADALRVIEVVETAAVALATGHASRPSSDHSDDEGGER